MACTAARTGERQFDIRNCYVSKTAKKHIISFCNDIEDYLSDYRRDMPIAARINNARTIAKAIRYMVEPRRAAAPASSL